MTSDNVERQFINLDAADIAVRYRAGRNTPGIVWLGGYLSDMQGTKAQKLDDLAADLACACLRFDYSGHGESTGDFYQGNISRWLQESLAVYEKFAQGPQVLVGSSMGGWIALLLAQALKKIGKTPHGVVLIAPAPDFTHDLVEPTLTDTQKQQLEERGFFTKPSEYGAAPMPFTKCLLDDGRKHLVMGNVIDIDCPVHIIQGMQDSEVPYQHTLQLMEHLPLNDVTLTLVHDGDHRLSRPQDIDFIQHAVRRLITIA